MKLAFQRRFLDDDGNPLNAGRITLYAHDSDTPLKVYYLEGDDYSPAENPMLTSNDGRIDTVFYEGGIIDVLVEKNNGDGTFELLDTFEEGMDVGNSGTPDTQVSTIEELRKVDPSMGTVTVTGYYTEGDAPVRMYMWDPDSTNTIDGGYVIGSDISDTGRWILIWDDEMIPCTVYGIIPGAYEENISKFLNFPLTVGTKAIATARICRFIAGEYSTTQNYYTNKTLYFDSGAKFPNGYFSCRNALIPSNTDYVADMHFNGVQKEVHSSWFKTIKGFLTCNAQRYVIDATNYFADANLDSQLEIADAELEFHARLPIVYIGNGRLTFSRCDIQGTPQFSTIDALTFKYTEIHDSWWQKPSSVDWVNKVSAITKNLNVLNLDNFTSVVAYVNAIKANGSKKVDLAGRYVENLDANDLTEIYNADCKAFTMNRPGAAVKVRNITCASFGVTCHTLEIRDSVIRSANMNCQYINCYDSTVSYAEGPTFESALFYRCEVNGSDVTPWTHKGQILVEDGRFNVNLDYVTDNENTHPLVQFSGCHFGSGKVFRLKDVTMNGCTFDNNMLAVYPHKEGDDYVLSVNLQNNIINTTHPVEFTRLGDDEKVCDCILKWTIVNNIFTGNSEGLRMRYWQKRDGFYFDRTFVKPSATAHMVTYKGNTGVCPDDTGKGLSITDNKAYVEEEVDGGSSLYKYTRSAKRLMPKMLSTAWWACGAINGSGMLVKYYNAVKSPYDSLSYDLYVQTAWFLYPLSHDDSTGNGDFFNRAILTFDDYVRIVQRGDGDQNDDVVAYVV